MWRELLLIAWYIRHGLQCRLALALRQKACCWGQHPFAIVTPTRRSFTLLRLVSTFLTKQLWSKEQTVAGPKDWEMLLLTWGSCTSCHWGKDQEIYSGESFRCNRIYYLVINRSVSNPRPFCNSRETFVHISVDGERLTLFFVLSFLVIWINMLQSSRLKWQKKENVAAPKSYCGFTFREVIK